MRFLDTIFSYVFRRVKEEELLDEFQSDQTLKNTEIYYVEGDWLRNYIQYLKGEKYRSIGPITNYKLLKNGRLKSIMKKTDQYYLLNIKQWLLIIKLYDGGP